MEVSERERWRERERNLEGGRERERLLTFFMRLSGGTSLLPSE